MKSREEYEASIFAKRDALNAKRKKNLRFAASAFGVMICLCAIAFAIPNLNKKPDTNGVSSDTLAAGGVTENKIAAEGSDETVTYPASYDTGIAYTEQHSFGYINDFCIETVDGEKAETTEAEITEIYRIPEGEIAVEQGNSAEKPNGLPQQFADGMGGFKPESPDGISDALAETPSKKSFTTEEIVAQAKKYVVDADKIIDDKTNVTVSRNANGTTTYTAYFYTEDKKIAVKLDSNLTAREIEEKDINGGDIQVTPGYNPDEE